MAWRVWDLPELRASLTGACWQVIGALRHFAWCAQSSSYFFGFVFIHKILYQINLAILWRLRLEACGRLWLGTLSSKASSFFLLIVIRGPNLVQP
jgi:hypothetical protein